MREGGDDDDDDDNDGDDNDGEVDCSDINIIFFNPVLVTVINRWLAIIISNHHENNGVYHVYNLKMASN